MNYDVIIIGAGPGGIFAAPSGGDHKVGSGFDFIQHYYLGGGGADVDSNVVVHLSMVSRKAARRVLS